MKIKNVKMISVQDWDELVEKTYGKPYSFQQQDGCKERGTYELKVPNKAQDFENDTVPEKINGEDMGVSFKAWLERDAKKPVGNETYAINIFWERNWYPDIQMIANDLHAKGLLEAGEYVINIDW
jgi:hypothetical protein